MVVLLGTDHHPFSRLVEWVDRWAGDHPDFSCLIQRVPAPPPRHARSCEFLPFDDLQTVLAGADVLVGHAGPGVIMDAHAAGRLPIIVPRLARFGEVVDDHQVAFASWMHQRRQAVLATDEAALHQLITDAVDRPGDFALEASHEADRVVERIGDLIDGLLAP
ncbi:N/A [soil metagenome]